MVMFSDQWLGQCTQHARNMNAEVESDQWLGVAQADA
jgi:hypothetical protein